MWAATAGAVASATLLALLGDTLPRPFRTLYLLGGAVVIASSMCQAWFWGGLTVRPEATPPEVARALVDVAAYFGPVLTGAMITMIAPVTLLALKRASGLPRWLGLFGAVVVLEQALETVTVFGHAGFTAPGGGMNMQLGAALVTGWSLAFAACRILGERETS